MTTHAHSVVDGKIVRLSVSQIESFASSLPFGCNRKWWFQKVAHLPTPQDQSQARGEQIHKEIETYLETGENCLSKIPLAGKWIIDDIRARYRGIEMEIEHSVNGIPLVGRIDCLASGAADDLASNDLEDEIIDWKTTSDILKYAKTVGQLRDSIQMNGYASWYFANYTADKVRVSLVYLQTRGQGAEKVSTVLDRKIVADRWTAVGSLVTTMELAAKETVSSRIPGNPKACRTGRGCPFAEHCPEAMAEGFEFAPQPPGAPRMSLFDRFQVQPAPVVPSVAAAPLTQPSPSNVAPPAEASTPTQVPAKVAKCAACQADLTPENSSRKQDGSAVHIGCKVAPVAVLPPDAPPSGSVVAAADPVPGFNPPGTPIPGFAQPAAAVEPPRPELKLEPAPADKPAEPAKKRGPGRPRKMPEIKDQAPEPIAPAPTPAPTPAACPGKCSEAKQPASSFRVTGLSLKHGATISMGNHQFAKVEVEMTAEGSEADLPKLSALVKAALDREVEPYLPKKPEPVTVKP